MNASEQPMSVAPPRLEMRGITKRSPGVLANDTSDRARQAAEHQAPQGENGPGRTNRKHVSDEQPAEDALLQDAGLHVLPGRDHRTLEHHRLAISVDGEDVVKDQLLLRISTEPDQVAPFANLRAKRRPDPPGRGNGRIEEGPRDTVNFGIMGAP